MTTITDTDVFAGVDAPLCIIPKSLSVTDSMSGTEGGIPFFIPLTGSMERYSNAEGGTNGVAVSAANSGNSGYAFTSGGANVTYDNTQVHSGTLSYKCAPTAATALLTWTSLPGDNATYSARAWFYFTGSIPVMPVLRFTGSTSYAGISIASGGFLDGQCGGNFYLGGSVALATGQWYRFECQVTPGTGNAQTIGRVYNASGTLLDSVTTPASGNTVLAPNVLSAGSPSAVTATWWMDDIAVSDQGWIGTRTTFPLMIMSGAEGGTNGVVVTPANSRPSGTPVYAGTQGNPTYSSATSLFGTMSYAITPASGANQFQQLQWSIPYEPGKVINTRCWFKLSATGTALYLNYLISGTGVSSITFSGSHLQAVCTSATTVTGTYTLAAGTWYRLEAQYVQGAGVSQTSYWLYDVNSNLLETKQTLANGSVINSGVLSFGNNSGQLVVSYNYDEIAITDQGWIGPNLLFGNAEAGSGLDVSSVPAATLPGSDTWSGLDAAAVLAAFLSADTGSGTDTPAVPAATLPGSDTWAGADSASLNALLADADFFVWTEMHWGELVEDADFWTGMEKVIGLAGSVPFSASPLALSAGPYASNVAAGI